MMHSELNEFKKYPISEDVDKWVESIWKMANSIKCDVEIPVSNNYTTICIIKKYLKQIIVLLLVN